MTAAEAQARFASSRVARLATADASGQPHVVPVTFALAEDRIVTAIDAKPKRHARLRRLANVVANPRVSLLVDGYDDEWSRLWWARADGVATIIAGGEALEHARTLLRDRYPQYADVALVGPAIEIVVERWSAWSANGSARPPQPVVRRAPR